jgi:uncharacterized damage-inducible protein DinB
MVTTLTQVQKRSIILMKYTIETLMNMLESVSQETATTFRDPNEGDKGWTTLEVVRHLLDFDGFFLQRAQMMLEQTHPALPAYAHEALAIERSYNEEDLKESLEALYASRQRFIAFFSELTPEQWARTGIHPERASFTMTDAVMQVGLHDAIHIEQITRILAQAYLLP